MKATLGHVLLPLVLLSGPGAFGALCAWMFHAYEGSWR